jgi:hypothetical protein
LGLLISSASGVRHGPRAWSAPFRTLPNARSARKRSTFSCAKSIIARKICSASCIRSPSRLPRKIPKISSSASPSASRRCQPTKTCLSATHGTGSRSKDLTRAQLARFADLIGSRIDVHGPKLRLKPASAQAIGLALHELATNAGKYGALSTAKGRIDIDWGTEGETLTMNWTERDGPPVSPPQRRGFGTIVMGQMTERSTGGAVDLDYAPSGLTWRLACPAANALEPVAQSVPERSRPRRRSAVADGLHRLHDKPLCGPTGAWVAWVRSSRPSQQRQRLHALSESNVSADSSFVGLAAVALLHLFAAATSRHFVLALAAAAMGTGSVSFELQRMI